jgi:hypothetical protein
MDAPRGRENGQRSVLCYTVRKVEVLKTGGRALNCRVERVLLKDGSPIAGRTRAEPLRGLEGLSGEGPGAGGVA